MPVTDSLPTGVVVPIPTFPFPNTVSSVVVESPALVDDAIVNNGFVPARPEESWIESLADGVEEPIPIFPLAVTLNKLAKTFVAVVVETLNRLVAEPNVPAMSSLARGLVVPMPTLPFCKTFKPLGPTTERPPAIVLVAVAEVDTNAEAVDVAVEVIAPVLVMPKTDNAPVSVSPAKVGDAPELMAWGVERVIVPWPLPMFISFDVPCRLVGVRPPVKVLPIKSWPSVYVVWPVPPLAVPRIPDIALIEGDDVADTTPLVAWRKPVRDVARVVAPLTFNVPRFATLEKRLVELAVVEKKLVEVAFVRLTFVPNRFVEVALPATSEDEYIFVEVELVVVAFVATRLFKVVLPETARVPVAVKLPPRKVLPETSNLFVGEVEPMPTFPVLK